LFIVHVNGIDLRQGRVEVVVLFLLKLLITKKDPMVSLE